MCFVLRFSIVNVFVNTLYFGHFRLFLKITRAKMSKNRIFKIRTIIYLFSYIKSAYS